MKPARIGVIGAGTRLHHVYGPLLRMLPGVELAGLHAPASERASAAATTFRTRLYPDLAGLLGDPDIDAVIACARWSVNPDLYLELARSDLPLLLETPLAADPHQAGAVAAALERRQPFTAVAEQYPERPGERLKRELIGRGLFGDVGYAAVDGIGHEYHAASLLRSYLGWPRPSRVLGIQRDLPLADHVTNEGVYFPGERVQHALIEFDNGSIAAYHWSWLNYDSPIRPHRVAAFSGTLGSARGDELVVFRSLEEKTPCWLRFDHRTRVVAGMEVPAEIAVLDRRGCVAKWQNPHLDLPLQGDLIPVAAFVENLVNATREPGTRPLYSVPEAAKDHEVVLAMYRAFASEDRA